MQQIDTASSRRTFIRHAATGTAAGTALMLAAPSVQAATAAARKRPYRENHRVDLHAHYLSPEYVKALHGAGIFLIGGIPIPDWSPKLALEFMDQHGIALQMLSVSDPGVAFLPDAQAVSLARACNDYAHGVVAKHPKRFGAFAVVPLHDVAAARAEVKHALGTLKLDGVGLLSSSQGRYLGDPAFRPLLADLNRRKAWVFVHPTAVAADDKPTYSIPDFIAEYPFDTTRTIISLLFNGAFQRYPNIRWHFAHGGGTVPMLRLRLSALAASAKQFGAALGLPSGSKNLNAKSAERSLKLVSYDTALVAETPALEAVSSMAGVDRMLFGSDWPFASRLYSPKKKDPQPGLSKVFSAHERHRIERLNARTHFSRARRATPKS